MSQTPFSLEGKSALITGGTSGIGLATARRFIAAGARVVISGRRDTGREMAEEIGAAFVAADLSDPLQVSSMVDEAAEVLGGIDILVSNAGAVVEFLMIEDTDDEVLDGMVNLNLLAHYRLLRSAIPHLREGGSVLFTGTLVTDIGNIGETAYSAAKAGLVMLAKGAAMELAGRGIRVNLVSPGPIEGEMWPPDHPQRDLIATLCPMGRLGNPDEIAALFQFLGADDCRVRSADARDPDGRLTLRIVVESGPGTELTCCA